VAMIPEPVARTSTLGTRDQGLDTKATPARLKGVTSTGVDSFGLADAAECARTAGERACRSDDDCS